MACDCPTPGRRPAGNMGTDAPRPRASPSRWRRLRPREAIVSRAWALGVAAQPGKLSIRCPPGNGCPWGDCTRPQGDVPTTLARNGAGNVWIAKARHGAKDTKRDAINAIMPCRRARWGEPNQPVLFHITAQPTARAKRRSLVSGAKPNQWTTDPQRVARPSTRSTTSTPLEHHRPHFAPETRLRDRAGEASWCNPSSASSPPPGEIASAAPGRAIHPGSVTVAEEPAAATLSADGLADRLSVSTKARLPHDHDFPLVPAVGRVWQAEVVRQRPRRLLLPGAVVGHVSCPWANVTIST